MDATATGHWKQMLKKVPDRELFLLRDQIEEVIALPGWERIIALVTSGHDAVLRSLTDPTARTREHADYARNTGYLSGLAEAPQVVQAVKEAAAERERRNESALIADQQRQGGPQ